jgi:hypothetical protein
MKGVILLLTSWLCLACQKDHIEVRRVSKESAPLPQTASPSHEIRWQTPKGWKEIAENGMRVASFELPQKDGKAEVSVISLPGDVGGMLANVNRWRGQIALPPLSEEQLAQIQTTVTSPVGNVIVFDFSGPGQNKTRIVAGVVSLAGKTWFFKLMGDDQAVTAAKPAFIGLLKGLRHS